jgi:hypothetical protein
LEHRRNERQLTLVGLPHGFDDPEVLDERRGRKIDIDSLRVLSPRIRHVHHVAVEHSTPGYVPVAMDAEFIMVKVGYTAW